jgi:hypothetical protein
MNERDQRGRTIDNPTRASDAADVGRSARTNALDAPAAPVASGLLMRAARDANGVAEGAGELVDRAAGSNGAPLPSGIMRKFESSLGADLSGVRVHTGGDSEQAASAVGAKAYTVGNDIHFGAGYYEPSSPAGEHLLAHEVAHTVQQRGAPGQPQFKLEVSTPHDAHELEADRAADAMVVGTDATVTGARGIARELADDMRREAAGEEKAAMEEPPMAVSEMTSIETVAQAHDCIRKVLGGNANLYQWRATQAAAVADAGEFSDEKEEEKTRLGFIDAKLKDNETTIGALQHIVDLGQGNSQTDDSGNRPGHDMQIKVFAQLAEGTKRDFARVQGTVNALLHAHPVDEDGGGKALGIALATGGKGSDDADLDRVKDQVQNAQNQDNTLNNMIVEYKSDLAALENNGQNSSNISAQMAKCASAVSKAKNIQAETDLGTVRPDTKEQADAKAETDKVNQELNEAKGALDKAADVAKLAVSVMGMPEVGVLDMEAIEANSVVKNAEKVKEKGEKIAGGVAKATSADVDKMVSEEISTKIAKILTDYDTKINVAKGHADQANANAKRTVVKLNVDKASVAKGDITQEFSALKKICKDIEDRKAALRKKAQQISDYQKSHKKPNQKNQPDIGAITTALAEVASYIEQADATIEQGKRERAIAVEMAASRKSVVGNFERPGDKRLAPEARPTVREDFTGNVELGVAREDFAYWDATPTPPHTLTAGMLRFHIMQDQKQNNVEVAGMEVSEILRVLEEDRKTAGGFRDALKKAMGASGD